MPRTFLTDRDRAVIELLSQAGHLSTAQLRAAVFSSTCLRRVQLRLERLRRGVCTSLGAERIPRPILKARGLRRPDGSLLRVWSLATPGQELAARGEAGPGPSRRLGADHLEAAVLLNDLLIALLQRAQLVPFPAPPNRPPFAWHVGAAARQALASRLHKNPSALDVEPHAALELGAKAPCVLLESALPSGLDAVPLKKRVARAVIVARRFAPHLFAPGAQLELQVVAQNDDERGALSAALHKALPALNFPSLAPPIRVLTLEQAAQRCADLAAASKGRGPGPREDLDPESLRTFCREALGAIHAARVRARSCTCGRAASPPPYPEGANAVAAWVKGTPGS